MRHANKWQDWLDKRTIAGAVRRMAPDIQLVWVRREAILAPVQTPIYEHHRIPLLPGPARQERPGKADAEGAFLA